MHCQSVRRSVVAGVLLFAGTALFCQGLRYELKEWRWGPSSGTGTSEAEPGFDDSSWKVLGLPSSVKPGKPETIFWLRTSFRVPDDAPARLWFLTNKGGVAMELYVNGEYAGSRGSLPPDFDLRATHCAVMLIPSSAARPGSTMCLALRCAYRGESAPLPALAIGDEAAQAFELASVNFWNGRLYLILSALCLFLAIYAILQFAFKRNEKDNLYYALTLFFMAFYLLDLGAEVWVFRPVWSRALARASLVLSMGFIVPFFTNFFGYLRSKWVRYGSVGTAVVFAAWFLANSGNDTGLSLVFNASLLPTLAAIGLCLYMSVRAALAGNRESWPVIVAVAIGLVLAGYDGYHTIVGVDPFAWLEGIAFFALNIAVFISLSMRQARLKSDLAAYAREAEANRGEIATSLDRMREAGAAASRLSKSIDEAAAGADRAAEEAARRSRGIGGDAARQAEAAREADGLVAEFVQSIERVHGNLASQAESVERTAAAANELTAGAESVAATIGRTAAFTSELAGLTGSGERAAASLTQAMERVSSASAGISEVVVALNEFTERTNLLAMNAAIEAAHSGQSGKGFAIIANEVKKLAQSQAERAARIQDIVVDISSRVGEGARDAEGLRKALREISEGSARTAERLEEARLATEEQKRASAEISASMESLAAAESRLRQEADRQSGVSGKVKSSVAAIAEAASAARSSAAVIVEESAGLASAVAELRGLAARGSELTAALLSREGGGS